MVRVFLTCIAALVAAGTVSSVSAQQVTLLPCDGSRARIGLMAGLSGDSERAFDTGLDAAASIELGVKDRFGIRGEAGNVSSTLGRTYASGEPTRHDDVRLRRVALMMMRTHTPWCEDRWRVYWGVGAGAYRYRFAGAQDAGIRRGGLRGLAGFELASLSRNVSWSGEVGLDAVRGPDDYPYTLFVASFRLGVKIKF